MRTNPSLFTLLLTICFCAACGEGPRDRLSIPPNWRPESLEAGSRCFRARWTTREACSTRLRYRPSGTGEWTEAMGRDTVGSEHRLTVALSRGGEFRLQFAHGLDLWSRSMTLHVPATLALLSFRSRWPESRTLSLDFETNQILEGRVRLEPDEGEPIEEILDGTKRHQVLQLRTATPLMSFARVRIRGRGPSGEEETVDCGPVPSPLDGLTEAVGFSDWMEAVERSQAILSVQEREGRLWGEGKRHRRLVESLDALYRHRDVYVRRIREGRFGRWKGLDCLRTLEIFNLTAEYLGQSAPYLQARELLREFVPTNTTSLETGAASAVIHLLRNGDGGSMVALNAEKANMLHGIYSVVSPENPARSEIVVPFSLTPAMSRKRVQLVLTLRRQTIPYLIRIEVNGQGRLMVVNRGSAERAAVVTQYLDITTQGKDWEKVMPLYTRYISVPKGLFREGQNEVRLAAIGYADHRNVMVVVQSFSLEFFDGKVSR